MSIKIIHQSAMSEAFKGKRAAADCAYCRKSEWKPAGYSCKKGLPMDARSCEEFRDSRVPSSHPPGFMT